MHPTSKPATATSTSNTLLRVGIMIDSMDVRAWAYEMVETIQQGNYARVETIIVNAPTSPIATGDSANSSQRQANALFRLPGRVITKLAHLLVSRCVDRDRSVESAIDQHDLRKLLPDTTTIPVDTIRHQYSDYLNASDVERIRTENLDVIIRVGFRILRGEVLECAKHGVWSLHHGDNRNNRGGPPCFWETMEGWPEVGSTLQVLSEELDGGQVLYRSNSPVYPYALTKTRNSLYWKSQAFIPRMLKRLHRDEAAFYRYVETTHKDVSIYSERLFRDPAPLHYLWLALKQALGTSRSMLHHKSTIDQWILLFHLSSSTAEPLLPTSMWRYKEMVPPADRFWADPHVLERQDRYYIFIEEFIHSEGKGHIAVIEMDKNGQYNAPVKVLERPYHLSYPFVFEADGDLWMIPETDTNNTIELYRCGQFPHQWEFSQTLMTNTSSADTTLHFQDGLWWMFVNLETHRNVQKLDELHLFFATDFRTTEWTPHPLNPIVSDVKQARMAGKIFTHNGRLYRPSQNCSFRYGYGFNLSEITLLDTKHYQETVVDRITPDWDPRVVGTHTFNQAGKLTVSDAMRKRRRWQAD